MGLRAWSPVVFDDTGKVVGGSVFNRDKSKRLGGRDTLYVELGMQKSTWGTFVGIRQRELERRGGGKERRCVGVVAHSEGSREDKERRECLPG